MKITELFYNIPFSIKGYDSNINTLVCDSNKVTQGALFAAIKGKKFDGHDFVSEAIKLGANAILCEKDIPTGKISRILVKNSRYALSIAAKNFYGDPSTKLKTIGITGTNGKTTISYFVKKILDVADKKTGIIGTLGTSYKNKKIQNTLNLTTPNSIDLFKTLSEMYLNQVSHLVMEISSHALTQNRIDGLYFDIAVFSNISHDHLDYHDNEKKYFLAKKKLFSSHLKDNAIAIINMDDKKLSPLIKKLNSITFSSQLDSKANIKLIDHYFSNNKTYLTIDINGEKIQTHTTLIGQHNIENILAASAVSFALKIDFNHIKEGIKSLESIPGRMEYFGGNKQPSVWVDYAHSPDALTKTLHSLKEISQGKLICVFGCGGERDEKKRKLMGQIASKYCDYIILTNDNPRTESPENIIHDIEKGIKIGNTIHHIEKDRSKAIHRAITIAHLKDTILIAGKGHENYQIIGTTKYFFDDRKEVCSALQKIWTLKKS